MGSASSKNDENEVLEKAIKAKGLDKSLYEQQRGKGLYGRSIKAI